MDILLLLCSNAILLFFYIGSCDLCLSFKSHSRIYSKNFVKLNTVILSYIFFVSIFLTENNYFYKLPEILSSIC